MNTGTPLGQRPAHHLARLMLKRGRDLGRAYKTGEARPISQQELARAVWPDQPSARTTALIRGWLDGRQTRWPAVEDVAAYFEVDAGVFYQEPNS